MKQIWKTYTVVGFWQATEQRWTAYYKARSHQEAENKALKQCGDGLLVVVASFEGELKSDPFTKVAYCEMTAGQCRARHLEESN